jgi:hypothetical protein
LLGSGSGVVSESVICLLLISRVRGDHAISTERHHCTN